jgi:LPXTG-motif cell wall-anchored protein
MLLLSAALLVVAAMPALAQQGGGPDDTYAPDAACALVSDSTPAPGETINVSGFIRQAGVLVNVVLFNEDGDNVFLGQTLSDEVDGFFSIDVTIPEDWPEGPSFLRVITESGSDVDACSAVLGLTITAGGGELPETGSNSTLPLTKLGVSLIAAGGVLVLATRKRRLASV